jgi:hypothetical protein
MKPETNLEETKVVREKQVQFNVSDLDRITLLLNNIEVKGIGQANVLVEIASILGKGKLID